MVRKRNKMMGYLQKYLGKSKSLLGWLGGKLCKRNNMIVYPGEEVMCKRKKMAYSLIKKLQESVSGNSEAELILETSVYEYMATEDFFCGVRNKLFVYMCLNQITV